MTSFEGKTQMKIILQLSRCNFSVISFGFLVWYCCQFSYLYLPAAGNKIVYTPRSGTNREKQYHIKDNDADFSRGITFRPSISSFPRSFPSVFQRKFGKRSVGNRHQKSYSRADKYQRNWVP